MEQVVDAIGAQQQFSNTVTELPTGGDQELRLLWGGQREPGQLTTRGKVTGADDGRNWDLGVDVAQERTVSAGGGGAPPPGAGGGGGGPAPGVAPPGGRRFSAPMTRWRSVPCGRYVVAVCRFLATWPLSVTTTSPSQPSLLRR